MGKIGKRIKNEKKKKKWKMQIHTISYNFPCPIIVIFCTLWSLEAFRFLYKKFLEFWMYFMRFYASVINIAKILSFDLSRTSTTKCYTSCFSWCKLLKQQVYTISFEVSFIYSIWYWTDEKLFDDFFFLIIFQVVTSVLYKFYRTSII